MQHVEKAVEYAEGVVGGSVVACEKIRLACKRFICDLERQSSDEFEYRFDVAAAERVCKFIELLPHTKGKWAAKRELIELQPWQCFIVCNLFGWLRKSDGLRRFREAYLQIPRKNGKSLLAAAIALYMFVADGEFGAEVFSGATSEKQAWEVFRPARLICKRTPELTEHYGVDVNAKNLCVPSDGSMFEPIIGNPGDGSSPHCAVIDEYHEHATDSQYDTMQTGMGARDQPLMLAITTAGSNIGGPCYEKAQDAEKVLNGTFVDESMFVVMFEADAADQWDSDEALAKANPNLGVSVSREFLERQRLLARRSASKQNAYRTKHLNQWVGARSAWLNMLSWQKAKRDICLDDFRGEDCILGLDLAHKTDVAALSAVFRRDDQWFTFCFGFVPEKALEENDKYRSLQHLDNFIVTPGNATCYATIEEKAKWFAANFNVLSVAFDPWQAAMMAQRLMSAGLDAVEYRHTVQKMSDPTKEVEALVLDDKLHHDGDPLLTWFMGNVMTKLDEKGNVYPTKDTKDSPNKIDGAIATIMAVGLWLAEHGDDPYCHSEVMVL